MTCIDEQRNVFESFCSERYGENGCQTSKTIAREKGQKIVRLLQNDPAADAYSTKFKFYTSCHNRLHATVVQSGGLRSVELNTG